MAQHANSFPKERAKQIASLLLQSDSSHENCDPIKRHPPHLKNMVNNSA